MFATAVSLAAVSWSAAKGADVEIGLGAPLLVDLMAWYVLGAYLGVFPTLV